MTARPLGIGLISVGWMGRAHSRAYRNVNEHYPELPVRPELVVAADVVEAELLRLDHRLPGLEATHRDEVARTVRRVVDKLLHAPTVRIKQLASAPGGDSYAEALRELFELDQTAVDAVATAGEMPPVPTDSAE